MFVILDWRQRSAQAKGRGPLVSEGKEETHWSLKQTCQLLVCVLRPPHYFTKRVPATEERYVWTLTDCICIYTKSPRLKNKNINYIFIYLRIIRYLSGGAICDTTMSQSRTLATTYHSFPQIYLRQIGKRVEKSF